MVLSDKPTATFSLNSLVAMVNPLTAVAPVIPLVKSPALLETVLAVAFPNNLEPTLEPALPANLNPPPITGAAIRPPTKPWVTFSPMFSKSPSANDLAKPSVAPPKAPSTAISAP